MGSTGHFGKIIAFANSALEGWIMFILPALLVIGLWLQAQLHSFVWIVPLLFMYLTFVSSIHVSAEHFKELWRNPRALIMLLILFHLLLPVISYEWISHVYQGTDELKLGILLAMIMPIGVTSIVWVNMAKGNVGIAVSMVALDTLISPILIPATLWLIMGKSIHMDSSQLIWGVMKLVVIPCILGILLGGWLRQKGHIQLRAAMSLSSKITLYLIILLNAAAMASSLSDLKGQVLPLILMVSGLMLLGYAIMWVSMRFLNMKLGTEIAFTYSGSIRNYTAGIVIAQLYFPQQTMIPVMIAVLFQHPAALLVHYLFKKKVQIPI